MQQVIIPIQDIKCLRGHLDAIEGILQKYGHNSGSVIGPDVVPKETKKDKVSKYKNLLTSGARGTKPNQLKKKK